jgi:hypothetical protein
MTVPGEETGQSSQGCTARFTIFPVLLIISCLALLVTLVVYSVLPDFRQGL